MKSLKTSEGDLQRAVFQWLKAYKVFAWRMPIGPVVHSFNQKGTTKTIWKASPLKGFPDICGVLRKAKPGVLFALELKTSKGVLSPEQTSWIADLSQAGACCAVIRSLQDLEQAMKNWGEI